MLKLVLCLALFIIPTINGACVDLTNAATGVSDCTRLSYLCTVSSYVSLMKVQCPKTCGYCSSTSTTTTSSSTCADLKNAATGVSDCTRLSYLCTNSAYLSLMKVQCKKTCGYCTSG